MGMHIYFSGIGGTGIGPLALIAHQAGYSVSGSDKQQSQYTDYLQKKGLSLHIGQTTAQIATEHQQNPIDWLVYSSALPLEQPNHPELLFAQEHAIRISKRDECLNEIINEKQLKMIAVAGTHGKTTTTAMLIWLFHQLRQPLSYSVGAKISFGDMGHYDTGSQYFGYECDEFDRNFLQFNPKISLITSVDWDHHEIYPTREAYIAAFRQFIDQSEHVILFAKDADYLGIMPSEKTTIIDDADPLLESIGLAGVHNRRNARLVLAAAQRSIENVDQAAVIAALTEFPGVSRRFEQIIPGLYSDYAHTPEEIAATIQLAREISNNIVVLYEPLTDRRQHHMKEAYYTVFDGVDTLYWLPSYLAREDANQAILSPAELIRYVKSAIRIETAEKNADLRKRIDTALASGALVLCLAGGGGGSLDEWIREQYITQRNQP